MIARISNSPSGWICTCFCFWGFRSASVNPMMRRGWEVIFRQPQGCSRLQLATRIEGASWRLSISNQRVGSFSGNVVEERRSGKSLDSSKKNCIRQQLSSPGFGCIQTYADGSIGRNPGGSELDSMMPISKLQKVRRLANLIRTLRKNKNETSAESFICRSLPVMFVEAVGEWNAVTIIVLLLTSGKGWRRYAKASIPSFCWRSCQTPSFPFF